MKDVLRAWVASCASALSRCRYASMVATSVTIACSACTVCAATKVAVMFSAVEPPFVFNDDSFLRRLV
ncbi:MAG: hypothetical protein GY765_41080 [bacterium]|nr:hypothetical protein [bacterium]